MIKIILSLLMFINLSFMTVNAYGVTFTDVNENDWFFNDVNYVVEKNLMNGTSDTEFSPGVSTTRGMIVTILWRLENKPDASSTSLFHDVSEKSYYYEAVTWAAENNIVSGYDSITFGSDDVITREQLATILYRYACYKNYNISGENMIEEYYDFPEISDYAKDALNWANSNNIITGTTSGTLSPKGFALRSQVAAILKRFSEKYYVSENATDDSEEDSKLYKLPPEMDDEFFNTVPVYMDSNGFSTDFDVSQMKNHGTNTWYVSADVGVTSATKLGTENDPFGTLKEALTASSSGDTIVFKEGVYSRQLICNTSDFIIKKSVNIIGVGNVIFKGADNHKFEQYEDETYKTTRSGAGKVIDISNFKEKGIASELKYAGSPEACVEERGTYFINEDSVYIHMPDGSVPTNDNCIVTMSPGLGNITIREVNEDTNVYVENINCIGTKMSALLIQATQGYSTTAVFKNCKFMHASNSSSNGVNVQGCNVIFQNCEAAYNGKDGFCYHADSNGVISNAIEINCIAYGNGNAEDDSSNGSTCHDGSKALRINGLYYNNKGANVADVNEGTVSTNLGCTARDSVSEDDNKNCDFDAQQSGAVMYLDRCEASGSLMSIRAVSDAVINIYNCKYINIGGKGDIRIDNGAD